MANRLKLPSSAGIHKVFHVSQLKAFHGEVPLTATLPTSMSTTTSAKVPQAILDRRVQKVHNVAEVQFLVQWEGLPDSHATWEVAATFVQQFLDFAYY